ncbi:MAG TPA: hypothetical protein VFU15_12310 [Bacteroidia bacterium]|nr:hypothetical protein [Bacteroidia bacterium]
MRNFEIALYCDQEFEITESNNEHYKLIYHGSISPGFGFYPSPKWPNIFVRQINKSDIKSGYQASTFANYKGFKFHVDRYENEKYRLTTGDEKVYAQLHLNMIDRGWYEIWVDKSEIEKMWEERKPSGYGFPMPEGLKKTQELNP